MIEITQMNYSILNQKTILEDLNLKASQGDFIGVLGKNGAGKTTLLDLIMGLRKPTKGRIHLMEQNPFSSDRKIFSNSKIVKIKHLFIMLPSLVLMKFSNYF